MSRLRSLRRDQLTSTGQEVWDRIVESRGDDLVNQHGGLHGPFNAIVHAPEVGGRVVELGRILRFESSIERRLAEVAIITVGARWRAEFEWWAHSRMALENGVPPAVVDAIGRGEAPPFESADERTVHALAEQLSNTGRVDEAVYNAARELFGDEGMVELVSLCGYYTMVSFHLNAFEVPLPGDAVPTWKNESGPWGAG